MSNDLICHVSPKGGIDDKIAQVLNNGYTKENIGTLRSLYDMDNKTPLISPLVNAKNLTGDEVLDAANKLMKYKQDQVERHKQQMENSTHHMATTFTRLYSVPGWDNAVRRNRINMVATEFTNEVNRRMKRYEEQGIAVSREDIINGRKSNGNYYDGQLNIFETIFNKFVDRFAKAQAYMADMEGITDDEIREMVEEDNQALVDEGKPAMTEDEKQAEFQKWKQEIAQNQKIIEEYPKILQNWASLCTFARISLRDTESLKLGQTLEYAAPTTPDNFTIDDPLENSYDLEESEREAWMYHQRQLSAYGSLGSEVRRFLSTLTDVDINGEKMTDDLGYTIKMDPLEMHTYLSNVLRGITTESAMIKKLRSLAEDDPRMNALLTGLAKASMADLSVPISEKNRPRNPVILTQLLRDMHKNMVPYSALFKDKANNVYAKILNRRQNPLEDDFTLRMQIHQKLDPVYSLYDAEGNVDWEQMARWNTESQEYFPAPQKTQPTGNNIFKGLNQYGKADSGFFALPKNQRINVLIRLSKAIGVPLDRGAAVKILAKPSLRNAYFKALQEFRTEGRNAAESDIMDIRKHLAVLEKHGGILPENVTDREEYRKALQTLKDKNITFQQFLNATYDKGGKKTKGVALERVYKMLKPIAEVTESLKMERRVSFFDRKGKANSFYSDRTPSYMGDFVDRLHEFVEEEDIDGLQTFIENKWGQSSFFVKDKSGGHGKYQFYNRWIQELYDSMSRDTNGKFNMDNDALARVFEYDEFLGSNIDKQVSIFENFTEKQHAEAMIKQFVQLLDQSKGRSRLAKYPCFILGDSGAQMFFTAKRYSQADIMSGLKDVYRQEIERMKYVKAVNEKLERDGYKKVANFSETANEFTMMKFLNPDFAEGKYWKILTGEEGIPNGRNFFDMAAESINTDTLQDALQAYMDDALADFKHKLSTVGILEEVKNADGTFTYLDKKGYFKKNTQWYKDNLDNLIEDFFWNTKYATIQQLQLFTVDPAFYDHRYPVKDLQKRYKEIYAPGAGISLEARDFDGNLYMERDYETAVYFDDISISSKDVNPYFFNLMQKTFGENSPFVKEGKGYTNNTLTDGQGYRSLKSYRAVMGMAGQWTRAMEAVYQRIKEIRNSGRQLTDADIRELAELAVVFQPIKPYLYTLEQYKINDEGDMALIPVQHKYAEVVLIPELMQDGKLKDMAKWMEDNDVDLLASDKCVKVGAFGGVELKGVNTTEGINNALNKALKHQLSWADYRIQSGVPEHLNHAQLFGTQIRKLILANINKNVDYNYLSNIFGEKTDDPRGLKVYLPGRGEVYLTGRNLIAFYNCLVMANMFDSYDTFSKDTATNQALSDRMIQNIISNANQAEDDAFGLALIDDGKFKGEFVIPPGEPGMEHDFTGLLLSMFRKQVNKQKIKGGSAVQASALGLSGYEDAGNLFEVVTPEGDNVLYDEIEMPWNVSYKSATGKDVALRFEDWCITDDPAHFGELKMSDQIVYGEDAKEYLSWPVSGRDKYGRAIDPSQGYYVPLIETKYKGILDILAYRIPTERDYSIINCKVYRFSSPTSGGTLKVPSSRTTTAGFDFDIDKLYFFMREFAQTSLTKKQVSDIWADIYGLKYDKQGRVIGGNDIYNALKAAKERDTLGQAALNKLLASPHTESAKILKENNDKIDDLSNLYDYWEAAELEGTAEEAFTKYLEDHRKEYPVFDTYNLHNSPLNPTKTTSGNTRVARNNMLFDLMRQRLMDKETLKARYTPGGFDNNRAAALKMRVLQFAPKNEITDSHGNISWEKVNAYVDAINRKEKKDPEPEYDVSDPTAILVYNQQNQVAGKLIGIFANQNTNHVYASTMHELALRNPIRFGRHTAVGLSDLLRAPEDVDVDTNVAEYLAASVDAVKDPVLNFLNLNLTTADAGALLARIGYTPEEIGLLFNQPIIKDLCNYVDNEAKTVDVGITRMLKEYGGKNATFKNFEYNPNEASMEKLANNILDSRETEVSQMPESWKRGQLHILWLFNQLMADTADLKSFVQATRFTAANSIGSTWGDMLAQEEKVRLFIEKYMKDEEEQKKSDENYAARDERRFFFQLFDPEDNTNPRIVHLDNVNTQQTNQGVLNISEDLLSLSHEEYMQQMAMNPLAFEQCMMDISRKITRDFLKKHFPYYTDLYTNMRSIMRRLTKYGGLDADLINSLHREFIVFMLSKQRNSKFDGEAMSGYYDQDTALTNREYYTRTFPAILQTLIAEGSLKGIPFFDFLTVKGDREADADLAPLQVVVEGMGGLQTKTSDRMREAWAQAFNDNTLISSPNIGSQFTVKDLAEGMYFYNFYKMGYNFHPTSSMSLTPAILKLGLRVDTGTSEQGYIDFINQLIKGEIQMDSDDLIRFAKQYILNHLDNKKLVFTPSSEARSLVNAYNNGWLNSFDVDLTNASSEVKNQFLLSDDSLRGNLIAFRPVIAVEREGVTTYYMADSQDNAKFNVTSSTKNKMHYTKVYAQGAKGEGIQYFSNAGFDSYQRNGSMDALRKQLSDQQKAEDKAKEQSNEAPIDNQDGTQMQNSDTDTSHIRLGQEVMFTDEQWSQIIKGFREKFPRESQGIPDMEIRRLLSDTNDIGNVEILNELARKLNSGQKMQTIDEKGEPIDVC